MIKVENVFKSYKKMENSVSKKQMILKGVSFEIKEGECLGIIGQSGSGKSTLGKLIIGIEKSDKGRITFLGNDIGVKKHRRGMISSVFQDYTSSINPKFNVLEAIGEPLKVIGEETHIEKKVIALLNKVSLDESYLYKYPHELSGGQIQRVAIARAISTNPKFILLDESVSSLDVSIQTQILDLLISLRKELKMSYLFITHDIKTATYICDRIIIFNEGQIVEMCDIGDFSNLKNEYSKKLIESIL